MKLFKKANQKMKNNQTKSSFSLLWGTFLFFLVATLYLGVRAFSPCESNFEGGCGMGKYFFLLGSLVPAIAATVIGFCVITSEEKGTRAYFLSIVTTGGSTVYLLIVVMMILFGRIDLFSLGCAIATGVAIYFKKEGLIAKYKIVFIVVEFPLVYVVTATIKSIVTLFWIMR